MPQILGSTFDTALWLGWLYPPLLLFLYVPCPHNLRLTDIRLAFSVSKLAFAFDCV